LDEENITVNNVKLSEFLKDKGKIKDQVQREKLYAENSPDVARYQKPTEKFKAKAERNGKVKILNQYEINRAEFKQRLEKSLIRKEYRNCVVICLLCADYNEYLNYRDISKKIAKVAKNLPELKIKLKNIASTVNWHLSVILRSKMLPMIQSGEPEKSKYPSYRIAEEEKTKLTFYSAFKLSSERDIDEDKKIKLQKKEAKKALNKKPSIQPELTPAKPAKPGQEDRIFIAVERAVSALKGADSVIKVEGDLVININLGGK